MPARIARLFPKLLLLLAVACVVPPGNAQTGATPAVRFTPDSLPEKVGGEWRAVDPTFGQPVADATHIKLIEGEDYGDIAPLVDLISKVGARIGSYEYRR